MPNGLDPDQDRHLSVLIWVRTVYNGYQQRVNFAASRQRIKEDDRAYSPIDLLYISLDMYDITNRKLNNGKCGIGFVVM